VATAKDSSHLNTDASSNAIRRSHEHAGNPQWAEHPRPLKDGGAPLHVEPGKGPDPNGPPNEVGPDGLTDHQRWGEEGKEGKKRRLTKDHQTLNNAQIRADAKPFSWCASYADM
jgi:hypothetical protein